MVYYVSNNLKFQHPLSPRPFKFLKSLLVKFTTPGTRLLVKCLAMWKDLCSNVSIPGPTENKLVLISLFNSTVLFTHNTVFNKKEFVAQETNFHKQNYKFQYTVLKLHKAFSCCCSLVHNELGNISRDVFPN